MCHSFPFHTWTIFPFGFGSNSSSGLKETGICNEHRILNHLIQMNTTPGLDGEQKNLLVGRVRDGTLWLVAIVKKKQNRF